MGKPDADPRKIILTEDEIRNGWSPDTLAAYLNEREEANTNSILFREPVRKSKANGRYNPLRFRRQAR